jgi:hypothetical protein
MPDYKDRHGIERLYGRFLFYKKFVALEKPLIIAEGKTDNVYLRAAIKQLPAYHAILRVTHGGVTSNNITFFKHSPLTREMLGLDGSSSYFADFIHNYKGMVAGFKHAPLEHPVIILIDNDDGAKGVFGVLSGKKINISHTTSIPFYPVVRNLYVLKTPESATPSAKSHIEELFDAHTLATKLNGKTFNLKNDTDTVTEYGKTYFAEHVVAPNADKINFAGFAPLLDRIVATIVAHRKRVAAGTV